MQAVILDRDGVINEDSDEFIRSPEEWIPIPGSLEAIARLHRAGITVAVATNQSGIGRGFLTVQTLQRIHARMLEAVRDRGGDLAAIVYCPHLPEEGCNCRKPAPGMLYEIARRLELCLEGLPLVGDSERDLVAARSVCASPILVRSGKGLRTLRCSSELAGVAVFDDLAAFVDDLLAGDRETA